MSTPRILAIQPGASYSTADVHTGLVSALEALGCEIIHYRLDGHIATAGAWMQYLFNRRRRQGQDVPKYTSADVVYKASIDSLERALRFQPDWVLVTSAMYFHPDALIMLRRAGQRIAVVLTESPYDEGKEAGILPLVDLAWTNERSCVQRLRQVNPNVFYLPPAFDPARHVPGNQSDDDGVAAHDAVFVGTYFRERLDMLGGVDWSGIDLGLYGDYTQIPGRSRLRQYIRGGIQPNARTAALYRRAKIGLNIYRTSIGFGHHTPRITGAESLNPRALELAATGCFHLSDERAEVRETFGALVPTFTDARSLERLVREWLPREDARRAIAHDLPARVTGHTFVERARQIVQDMSEIRELVSVG